MSRDVSIPFGSLEELFEWMQSHEEQAIAGALDEQWAIDWGARAFRIVDDLAIYGEVYTENQFLEIDGPIDEVTLDEESRYELDMIRDAHRRGYRYGRWYSEVVPDGEYGSAHVVSLWEISRVEFEESRALGWLNPGLVFKIGQRVAQAYLRKEETDG